MKNIEIISMEEIELIKTGKMREDEEIHTFHGWKARGYSIRRGEKAIAKFPIWKSVVKKTDDGDTEDRMIMKTSCWFSTSQVERS